MIRRLIAAAFLTITFAAGTLAADSKSHRVTIQIDPGCAMPIAARQMVLNALLNSGEILAEREKTAGINRLQFLFATPQSPEEIAAS